MQITINNTKTVTLNGETLIETARRIGYNIPSLCYIKGVKHKPSCMLCAVKDCNTGQIVPSCATLPTEGMIIETDSEDIKTVRTLSLELLLSDHRADCEAPCSLVCPKGLEIEKMLDFYDNNNKEKALNIIAKTFLLPDIPCNNCKAPCEKACRRGTIDNSVEIRKIIKELIENGEIVNEEMRNEGKGKNMYQSRLGRFTEKEKEWLKTNVATPSRCLHCACAGREKCKLRFYATELNIKRPRYEATSSITAMNKQHITNDMRFEAAKCIRCGLCVYNSKNGFTFKDRGFGLQVVLPEENRENVGKSLVELCPTGAIYKFKKLLLATDYLSQEQADSLLKDAKEIYKILGKIQITIKNRNL